MKGFGLKILIVDDEVDYCRGLRVILSSSGNKVDTCNSGIDALRMLQTTSYDLIITDLLMPNMSGSELLKEAKKSCKETEVIVLTAFGSIKTAVEVMKEGAYTYVTKGENPEELILEVERLREIIKLKVENNALKEESSHMGYMLQTKNKAYAEALSVAKKVASSDLEIMLLGESGVGKEVMARYIYSNSNRKDSVFMDLNCHSIAESVFESELFGHEKGSFTGAGDKRVGRIEASDGGTLFLDEIGDIPLPMQAKLLKAVEEKKVYRMGSNEPIHLDFRIISATNKDLETAIEEGHFRSDLYYRLNSICVQIPPLRERREDLPMLIDYFMKQSQREMKKEIHEVDCKLMDFLLTYDYPGNVRELKNIIERLIVLSEGGYITMDLAPKGLKDWETSQIGKAQSLRTVRKDFEAKHIKSLLATHNNDLNKVAEVLEITKRQLFNKINELDLKKRD